MLRQKVTPISYDPITVIQYKKPYPNGSPVAQAGYPITYNQNSKESWMYGEDIPNFHARVKAGELLPMTGFRKYTRETKTWGYEDLIKDGFQYYYTPSVPFGEIYIRTYSTTLESLIPPYEFQQLVTACAAKIQNSGFDALTFLAELKKTWNMFSNMAYRFVNLARGKPPNVSLNEWLEGRYGWRPFLHDMADLSDALMKLDKDKRTRLSERVGNTARWTRNVTIAQGTGGFYQYNYTALDEIECSVRASIAADIDVQAFAFDPIRTAWELVPYSFVIDWFINVGQSLAAAEFLYGAKQSTASFGYKITMNRTVTGVLTPLTGVTFLNVAAGGFEKSTLERRTPTSVSVYPSINVNLDKLKIFDLLALLIQRFR